MGSVSLKGVKDGIEMRLSQGESFSGIIQETRERLLEAKDFFADTALNLIVCGRVLDPVEEEQLQHIIETILPSNTNIVFSKEGDKQDTMGIDRMTGSGFTGDENALFIRGTVRSGQVIETGGNLIIAGDVNPGAQLMAGGDIMVMGNLRGTVHAGRSGNRAAVVIALTIAPSQLRIADMITRAPDKDEVRRTPQPEIAYIKDGTIYIDDYSSRKM